MTLAQIYLDTPEIELFGDYEMYNQKKMKVKRTVYVPGTTKKPRTDRVSYRATLPKLRNEGRLK